MALTAFTGKNMTFTGLEGITDIALDSSDGPDAAQIEKSTGDSGGYEYLTDPLGAQGSDSVKVTVTCFASSASYADNKASKVAFNSPGSVTFDMAAGTTNANTWTHTALELTKRTTRIPYDNLATVVMEYGANSLGTWDSPA